jgi:hypothetical protein
LIGQKLIRKDEYEQIQITDKFNIYFFKIYNNQCALFDKFFQAHYWGITDYDRKVRIPTLIKEKLSERSRIIINMALSS